MKLSLKKIFETIEQSEGQHYQEDSFDFNQNPSGVSEAEECEDETMDETIEQDIEHHYGEDKASFNKKRRGQSR